MLEPKSEISEMKNSLDGLYCRLETAGEKGQWVEVNQ